MITNIIQEFDYSPSVFYYIPNFLNELDQENIMTYLDNTKDFKPNPKYNDKISREQKWFQKDNKYFCPQWKMRYPHWTSSDMDDTIRNMINKVQDFTSSIPNINIPNINSCLVNKYKTGENFIAPHRDSEISFGEEPTIIGLSLGAKRTIFFERNDKSSSFTFDLESGSIFIMAGSSQRFYKHSIQKSPCQNVRYSLTFREFIL
jgi:alkylated DNA repair dioxygenase AlkB